MVPGKDDLLMNEEDENPDENENVPPRMFASPTAPSRQEAQEHAITHLPFRSWCPFCLMGKAKCSPHRRGIDHSDDAIPMVAFDYCFMGETEQPDMDNIKILVGRDRKSRCYAVIPVPQKGVDHDQYAVKRGLRFLDFLGYKSVLLKSDQETSLSKIFANIKAYRGSDTQTMTETSPAYDSKSNGFVERAIQVVEGQIRTLKAALEDRLGQKLPLDAHILPWLVEHAGTLLNMFELSDDGKVPIQRLRGRKVHTPLVEFGESVQFMPLNIAQLGKMTSRTIDGIYLGVSLGTGESLVGNSDGIFRTRSIHRKPLEQRWSLKDVLDMKGLPWKPYTTTDDDKIHVRIPTAAEEDEDQRRARAAADPEYRPRTFKIDKRDVIKYGQTPGCTGCHNQMNGLGHKPHTPLCRERFGKLMMQDPLDCHRVANAQQREYAYHERQLRKTYQNTDDDKDTEQKKDDHAHPQPELPQHEQPDLPQPEHEQERAKRIDGALERALVDFDPDEEDMELEDKLITVPDTDMHMIENIIAILNTHISEVYSPPRLAKIAHEYGLLAGTSFDITMNDETGMPWDFDMPSQRQRCRERIEKEKPKLLVGSPMCTAFSIIQNLNRKRMGEKRWKEMIAYGTRHLLFVIELYELQLRAGRYILHEHPLSASSWHLPELTDFMHRWDLKRFSGHMCRFGMTSEDANGPGLVKKPTGFICNADYIVSRLNKHCTGDHRHVHLMNGRADAARIYPDDLCRQILLGLKEQLTADGDLNDEASLYHLMTLQHDDPVKDYVNTYIDDLTGKILDPEMVKRARQEEMDVFTKHNVFTFVPLSECYTATGKGPIGTRWVDINKNDDANPEYRSRCVAQEIKRGHGDEQFAGTPPWEAKKTLFSLAMTSLAGDRACRPRGVKKLCFVDVRRAYFYAPTKRAVYVKPPEEAGCPPGHCARLNASMYGTRDAAANWEEKYASHLKSIGFIQGLSSPCIFYNPDRDIQLVVHGDDFTFLAAEKDLLWCVDMMQREYEIKMRGIIGPERKDSKEIRLLNRCIEWRDDGIYLEADPRHSELIVQELGLEQANNMVTPCVKTDVDKENTPLDKQMATTYRRIVARCNFLSMDRADIAYATKECAKGMAAPGKMDLERLKRLGRYLKGNPRYLMRFGKQKNVYAVNAFADSDWAGDRTSRKSTSGGVLQIGNHVVKTWSTNQAIVALSSGEAELYATNKAAAQAIGLRSLLKDLGVRVDIRLFTDSSTSKAITMRTGLGKLRHISTNELWLQQKIKDKELVHQKIKNIYNSSDLLTKPQDPTTIRSHMELMDHHFSSGRSTVAPDLNNIDDLNGAAYYLFYLLGMPCAHT